jgi:hypothetical protein
MPLPLVEPLPSALEELVALRESRIDGEGSAVGTIGRMVYSIKDVTDRP